MEFANLGKHCALKGCNQQDFLPFVCEECHKVYCLQHRSATSHGCTDPSKKNIIPTCPICSQLIAVGIDEQPDIKVNSHINSGCKTYILDQSRDKCTMKGCNDTQMSTCKFCSKNFCLKHRFQDDHKCPVQSSRDPLHSESRFAALGLGALFGFGQSKSPANKQPEKSSPNPHPKPSSPNSNTNTSATSPCEAAKHGGSVPVKEETEQERRKRLQKSAINRMRIKMKAVGEKNVPDEERFFAEVFFDPSLTLKPQPLAVFLRSTWTVGRALDSICNLAGIVNDNANPSAKKLRLYIRRLCGAPPLPFDIPLQALDPELTSGEQLTICRDSQH